MSDIKLVALDLDGTLFNNSSRISAGNLAAIKEACSQGVYVVLSTGRPYQGLPFDQIKGSGIAYAITTNGSAVYEIEGKNCIFEDSMPPSLTLPIIRHLLTLDIHMDAFVHGIAYTPEKCVAAGNKIDAPEVLKKYILETRTRVEDIIDFVESNQHNIQKMTLNFYPDANGVLVDRAAAHEFLLSRPEIECVSGGYNNLEFTKRGVDKGVGLHALADYLGIPMSQTMAIGDTGNDVKIIQAAGFGVAMGNATEDVLAVADAVTLTNVEDGVAAALRKYVL